MSNVESKGTTLHQRQSASADEMSDRMLILLYIEKRRSPLYTSDMQMFLRVGFAVGCVHIFNCARWFAIIGLCHLVYVYGAIAILRYEER